MRLERDVRRSVDGHLKVIEQLSLFIVSVYTDDSFHEMSSSNKGGLISESISLRLHLPNILPITSLSIFSLERNTQNKDFAQIKFWKNSLGLSHLYWTDWIWNIFLLYLGHKFFFFIPFQPKPIDVNVISHQMQRYAVWFGGSMLASTVRTSFLFISIFTIQNLSYEFWICFALLKTYFCLRIKIV